jgi:hypothetical protein
MLDLKRKYVLKLNNSNYNDTKEIVKSNSLDVNNCLFTPELLTYLLKANVDKSTSMINYPVWNNRKVFKDLSKKGIYLIAFRIFNQEKKIIVYNYIYYNNLLYLTFIVYFLTRNYFITKDNHEWGKYLVILDNIFLDYLNEDKYFYLYTKDRSKHKS